MEASDFDLTTQVLVAMALKSYMVLKVISMEGMECLSEKKETEY